MALWKFTHKNKYGNLRSRIIYRPKNKPFSFGPGFGNSVFVSKFKYEYTGIYPPHLYEARDGNTYILPSWQKVDSNTTLNDIEWIKPEFKSKNKFIPEQEEIPNSWEFKSSSSDATYVVSFTKKGNLKCTCPGTWRAKDRRCKHIKQVENELK